MTIFLYILAAVCAAAVLAAAFYSGLTVRNYTIESPKIKDNGCLRIVHLSDLHSTSHGKGQKRLRETIELCMPDMIVMTGDMVDDRRKDAPARELFSYVQSLGIPAYCVCGNHETYISDLSGTLDMIRSYGIRPLDGESEEITVRGVPMLICGISDPRKYSRKGYEEWEKAIRGSFGDVKDRERLTILLSHRPEKAKLYSEIGFDIAFCGHAHGGQARIPGLINGLYYNGQGLFPKYAGGIYSLEKDKGRTVMTVSRGLSVFWNLPRIFNPPEVVCVTVSAPDRENIFTAK